jgi:hypothetical protein
LKREHLAAEREVLPQVRPEEPVLEVAARGAGAVAVGDFGVCPS